MIQEEKQLLFKDLCGRLPYGVKCFCKWSKEAPNGTVGCIQEISAFLLDEFDLMDEPEYGCQVSEIRPYLRPMSSMTEEEKKEYWKHGGIEQFDYLNSIYVDYRGLIEKGLALEAPEGMYE